MLLIEPSENGQRCDTCPLWQNNIEVDGVIYDNACKQIDYELNIGDWACFAHSITIKPEFK